MAFAKRVWLGGRYRGILPSFEIMEIVVANAAASVRPYNSSLAKISAVIDLQCSPLTPFFFELQGVELENQGWALRKKAAADGMIVRGARRSWIRSESGGTCQGLLYTASRTVIASSKAHIARLSIEQRVFGKLPSAPDMNTVVGVAVIHWCGLLQLAVAARPQPL